MQNLSKADMNFLMGNGPECVKSTPMIRKQGNGNFTGFVRTIWSDDTTSDAEFIVNAKSRGDVELAYTLSGGEQ